jgi:UDP-2,3-diacylglucosamine pyrophosphatase LpxH
MLDYQRDDSIIVSDLHIGSLGSRTGEFCAFLDFLSLHPPKRLIFAGDVFEMWNANYKKMGRHEYDIISKTLLLSEKGTRIVYIPGNHDRAFRGFRKITFGKIKIRNEYVLRSHHKKYLIIHGDEFDAFTSNHIILSLMLDQFFVLLIRGTSFFKRFFGFNISLAAKRHSGRYMRAVERIRRAALRYARSRKMNGIILGHSHWPEVREDIGQPTYANSGDWIENKTYVVIGETVSLRKFEPL